MPSGILGHSRIQAVLIRIMTRLVGKDEDDDKYTKGVDRGTLSLKDQDF